MFLHLDILNWRSSRIKLKRQKGDVDWMGGVDGRGAKPERERRGDGGVRWVGRESLDTWTLETR